MPCSVYGDNHQKYFGQAQVRFARNEIKMDENLKDILSNLNPDIDQETLLLYLQGKLSADEQHKLEKQMMNSDFDSDALEGLQDLKNKTNIASLVHQLNSDLKKRTQKKKRFKEKLKINSKNRNTIYSNKNINHIV